MNREAMKPATAPAAHEARDAMNPDAARPRRWAVAMGPYRFAIDAPDLEQAGLELDRRCNLLGLQRAGATFDELHHQAAEA